MQKNNKAKRLIIYAYLFSFTKPIINLFAWLIKVLIVAPNRHAVSMAVALDDWCRKSSSPIA